MERNRDYTELQPQALSARVGVIWGYDHVPDAEISPARPVEPFGEEGDRVITGEWGPEGTKRDMADENERESLRRLTLSSA